jgi:Cof subfamily protein (haloacid dehalogenase superfamily)
MIKLIATDMDGTLLNATQEISEGNKQAILEAQTQGVEVVIATGRNYQEASFVLMQAGLNCPMICVNGAEVRSMGGEVISSHPIPALEAKVAAMKLMEHGVYFEVYSNKGAFTNDKEKSLAVLVDIFMSANPDIDINEVLKAAEARFEHGLVQVVDDYEKLFSNEETKIYKFLAFSLELEKLALVRDTLENMETIVVSSSGHENLEITSTDAQKGIALEAFAASKDISLAETMAIGDNFNDLSMFKRAGKSVAMGNASDVIKAQCDLTTASNVEDGVAQAIYEAIKASV